MRIEKPNKKARRHEGWKTARNLIKMPKKWIINNCLDPIVYYDEWMTWRDGCRGYPDHSRLRFEFTCCGRNAKRYNNKIKRMIKIRKAKKEGRSIL